MLLDSKTNIYTRVTGWDQCDFPLNKKVVLYVFSDDGMLEGDFFKDLLPTK